MDIKNCVFKIVEQLSGFIVLVEVPRVVSEWSWRKFKFVNRYDMNKMTWAQVNAHGLPMRKDSAVAPARFAKFSEAKQFIERIREPKRETIIGRLHHADEIGKLSTKPTDDDAKAIRDAVRKQNGKAPDLKINHGD